MLSTRALLHAARAGVTAPVPALPTAAQPIIPAMVERRTRCLVVERIMISLLTSLKATIVKLLEPTRINKREDSAHGSVFLNRPARLDQPRAQSANVVTVFVFGAHQQRVVLLCNEFFIEHAYQPARGELA